MTLLDDKPWTDYELYETALLENGFNSHLHPAETPPCGSGRAYWAVRFAARATAYALLQTAQAVGVTPEQLEALRATAARVATD